MKYCVFIAATILLSSCATLQVASNRSTRNMSNIGIEWTYSGDINEWFISRIDSAIYTEMSNFNQAHHSFSDHKKNAKDKDYISLDISKGKIATKGEKAAGYIVSGLGLIATPATLVALKTGYVAAFHYWPENKLFFIVSLSPNLSEEKTRDKKLLLETGALFSRTEKQTGKLVEKFSQSLDKILLKTEEQLAAH